MTEQVVTCSIEDYIATVTIDNPPMNPLTTAVRDQLCAAFDDLESRLEQVRAVILTGRGKAFVAGADIKSFPELTEEIARVRLKRSRAFYLKIERFERPVICAINGFCLGGGLELAMCCDIRIASTTARLGQPEVNVGVIPGGGGTQRLPRLAGIGLAKELIYTGEWIDAKRAAEIGLVNRTVEPEVLMDEALKLASMIAEKPPLGIRAAKEAIDRGRNLPLEEGLRVEAHLWSGLCGTEDQKEGARAFIEKRKPRFVGR